MSSKTTRTEMNSRPICTIGMDLNSGSRNQKKYLLAGVPILSSKNRMTIIVTPSGKMTTMPVMNAFRRERNMVKEVCLKTESRKVGSGESS